MPHTSEPSSSSSSMPISTPSSSHSKSTTTNRPSSLPASYCTSPFFMPSPTSPSGTPKGAALQRNVHVNRKRRNRYSADAAVPAWERRKRLLSAIRRRGRDGGEEEDDSDWGTAHGIQQPISSSPPTPIPREGTGPCPPVQVFPLEISIPGSSNTKGPILPNQGRARSPSPPPSQPKRSVSCRDTLTPAFKASSAISPTTGNILATLDPALLEILANLDTHFPLPPLTLNHNVPEVPPLTPRKYSAASSTGTSVSGLVRGPSRKGSESSIDSILSLSVFPPPPLATSSISPTTLINFFGSQLESHAEIDWTVIAEALDSSARASRTLSRPIKKTHRTTVDRIVIAAPPSPVASISAGTPFSPSGEDIDMDDHTSAGGDRLISPVAEAMKALRRYAWQQDQDESESWQSVNEMLLQRMESLRTIESTTDRYSPVY